MERYFNNENGDKFFDDDDDNEEFGPEDGEATLYIDESSLIGAMQMDLAQSELNQHLLGKAIDIASNSWFWKFKSTAKKLTEIEGIYFSLLRMTEEGDKEDADV